MSISRTPAPRSVAGDDAQSIIRFHGVSKTFERHGGQSLLRHRLGTLLGRHKTEPFYALRNVSFSLMRGEGLAVVGRNGAGKSTLLSLVAGLCEPDEGRVFVNGRVGALLELGTGFHPDLTGRENLHLNAALVGFTRAETERLEPSIVDFAELGEFIDEPLRTYSTGMGMRLAFAIAVHAQPDILIVDELLAVGDARFQLKCRERIVELRDSGCTFLFVSHSAGDVENFCRRAIWLHHGAVVQDGSAETVLANYGRSSGEVSAPVSAESMAAEPADLQVEDSE